MRIGRNLSLIIFSVFSLSLLALGCANAQPMSPVAGSYISRNGLIEITFPPGWNGFELEQTTVDGAMVSTSELEGPDNLDFSTPVMVLISTETEDLSDPDSLISTASNGVLECRKDMSNRAWLNDAIGVTSSSTCTATTTDTSLKMKSVLIETNTNWVMAAYIAPETSYDENIEAFNSTLRSFKVFNPLNQGLEQTLLNHGVFDVHVADTDVQLELSSSSSVESFAIDENLRQIHFQVNETGSPSGVTIVPAGIILEGPYSISIDGEPIQYDESNMQLTAEPGGEEMILITYPPGIHEIAMTGVRVVPEFSALPILMVVLSMAAVIVAAVIFRGSKLYLNN